MLDIIGGTPCVQLRRVAPAQTSVCAKLELLNPGGSAADRIAAALIHAAEADGTLQPGATIIEATLGNTGIALAQACAGRGYKVIACMPESMSLERRAVLKLWGATVELTPSELHLEGAKARAKEIGAQLPGAWVMPQWDIERAADLYARSLGAELVEQVRADGGRIDAFVAGIGTGASLKGAARALREAFPGVEIVAVAPAEPGPHRLQGLAPRQDVLRVAAELGASVEEVSSPEAWAMKERLGREEGLLAGITSGAAVRAASRVAARRGPGARVYTVLWDTGERYFSLAERFR